MCANFYLFTLFLVDFCNKKNFLLLLFLVLNLMVFIEIFKKWWFIVNKDFLAVLNVFEFCPVPVQNNL